MIKLNELKAGMRIIGKDRNGKKFKGIVIGKQRYVAYILRDDNEIGSGKKYKEFKTWKIYYRNKYWHADCHNGILKIDKQYKLI